jgi:Thrombospondin type 1 domain
MMSVVGCTFELAEVESLGSSDAGVVPPVDSGVTDAPTDSVVEKSADVAQDVAEEVKGIDGCWPPSDAEFCTAHSYVCGTLSATDACGQARSVACGACAADSHCEQGACIAYTYTWSTGEWSSCSASCDGGTQSRSVSCKRDDGTVVDDSKCGGSKPAGSGTCNTQPCNPPSGPVIVDTPLVSATQIGLSWQAVAGATEYFVLWSNTGADYSATVTTTWIVIDADTSLDHWVSIFACNSAGCGDPAQFGPISL